MANTEYSLSKPSKAYYQVPQYEESMHIKALTLLKSILYKGDKSKCNCKDCITSHIAGYCLL